MDGLDRKTHIDLAAGILIIWIMCFHALGHSKVFGEIDARVALPFLTFSMPWFFYKSGQFFGLSRGCAGIRKDAKKFLGSFLKWGTIGYAVHLLMMAIDGTFTLKACVTDPLHTFYIYGYIPIDVPLWFILSLFFVKLLSYGLLKLRIHPVFCIIAGLGISYLHHLADNPGLPVYLSNIPMGMAFFMMGYLLKNHENKIWLWLPCLAVYLYFIFTVPPIVGLHRNVHLSGGYLLWPVFGLCGTVAFNKLCYWIRYGLDSLGLEKFRPISFLGRNSLLLLVTHAFIYQIVIHYSTLPPKATFGLCAAGYLLILIPMLIIADRRSHKREEE